MDLRRQDGIEKARVGIQLEYQLNWRAKFSLVQSGLSNSILNPSHTSKMVFYKFLEWLTFVHWSLGHRNANSCLVVSSDHDGPRGRILQHNYFFISTFVMLESVPHVVYLNRYSVRQGGLCVLHHSRVCWTTMNSVEVHTHRSSHLLTQGWHYCVNYIFLMHGDQWGREKGVMG